MTAGEIIEVLERGDPNEVIYVAVGKDVYPIQCMNTRPRPFGRRVFEGMIELKNK